MTRPVDPTAPAPVPDVPTTPVPDPPPREVWPLDVPGDATPVPVEVVSNSATVLDWVIGGGTAVAALAASVAAYAAVKQSRRSIAAARDALEALGRVLAPEQMGVDVGTGNREWNDYKTPEEWPGKLRVQVRNRGRFDATDVVVVLTDAAGQRWPKIGPMTVAADTTEVRYIERFSPACPDPDPKGPPARVQSTAQHGARLTYSDERRILGWEQTYTVTEQAWLSMECRRRSVFGALRPKPTGRP